LRTGAYWRYDTRQVRSNVSIGNQILLNHDKNPARESEFEVDRNSSLTPGGIKAHEWVALRMWWGKNCCGRPELQTQMTGKMGKKARCASQDQRSYARAGSCTHRRSKEGSVVYSQTCPRPQSIPRPSGNMIVDIDTGKLIQTSTDIRPRFGGAPKRKE